LALQNQGTVYWEGMSKAVFPISFCAGITCLFASVASASAGPAMQINQAPYHGWREALIISNGKVEAVIVPEVGRIMQFRFAGENDGPLWENRALDGKPADAASTNWGNFGGDKTWPSPQADWEAVTGRGWPPPVAFDSMPLKARVDHEEIILESAVDPHYGIQTERRISLVPDKAEMRVRTIYLKKAGKPVKAGIWVITQTKDPEKVFIPLRPQSIFPSGYEKQSEQLPAALNIEGGILSCARSHHGNSKIGSDADTLIWADKRWILKVTSPREKDGEFPDQGSSAEIYTNGDPLAYVELELLGPLKEMKIDDQLEREEAYSLFRRIDNLDKDLRQILK
jgi:hypothetical protein